MSVTSEPAPAPAPGPWVATRDQPPWLTEDWLSVGIGLTLAVPALLAVSLL